MVTPAFRSMDRVRLSRCRAACIAMAMLALLPLVPGFGHAQAAQPSGHVTPVERRILVEFFAATGGERWTKRDGWDSSSPVCDWYGVVCDFVEGDPNRPFVSGLSLALNNLEGRLPTSLADLPRLRSLEVAGNRLSGTVPEPLMLRWDAHRLELSVEGNAFADVVVRVSVEYSAPGTLCAEHDDLRYRLDLDSATGRAVFQSVRCAPAQARQTYCYVREGTPPSFVRLSRELTRLGFARFDSQYNYRFSGVTHGTRLTTTAAWADRSRRSVATENRQGPREVWIAQQLFLGLLAESSWEREARQATCDFEK